MEKKVPTEILNAARNLAELHTLQPRWAEPMPAGPGMALISRLECPPKLFLIEQLLSGPRPSYDITEEVFTAENSLEAYLIRHAFKGTVYHVQIDSDLIIITQVKPSMGLNLNEPWPSSPIPE